MLAGDGYLATRRQISVERRDDRRVQRHEPALAEIGVADMKYAVGPDVVEPERDRVRDAKPVAAVIPNSVT